MGLTAPNPTLVEFEYFVTPDGEEFTLQDNRYRFIMSSGGYGMPPISWIVEKGPFQHGVTPIDFRLQPRVIQMLITRNAYNRQKYWDNRADMLNFLRPNRQAANSLATGDLHKIMPDGTHRAISVLIERGPEFKLGDPNTWDEWRFEEVLRFIAFDPTFFDPAQVSLTFTLAAFSNLVFPITFPIEFGGSSIDETVTVAYVGTWEAFPTIIIVGPLDSPIITNNTTSEKIDLGFNVAAGQTVTINLDYGEKTVEDQDGNDLIGTLSTDSDLSTFHVAPDPEAPDGDNTFRVQGGGADPDQTSVSLTFMTRFIGI